MKKLFNYFFCGISVFFLSVLVLWGCSKELTDEQKLDRIKELYSGYKKSFPDTPDVSVEELTAMQGKADIVLIDRRERREQEVSMVPGAITSEEFERNIERYRDRTIVVYCTIGNRSGHYAKGLIEKGMRAYNLEGSILAWAHAGEELVSEGKPTQRVHVYGPKWNLLPKEYEAVWGNKGIIAFSCDKAVIPKDLQLSRRILTPINLKRGGEYDQGKKAFAVPPASEGGCVCCDNNVGAG